MFEYANKKTRKECVTVSNGFGECSSTVFRPTADGVKHSSDLSSDSGYFLDFSADRLVASGVDVGESSKPFSDSSIDTLEDVDIAMSKILDSEQISNDKINN